jgi:YD repeat-containing protein
MTFTILNKHQRLRLFMLAGACALSAQTAFAQDATTYGAPFPVPVFERVDLNGVDLVTGSLRVISPTYFSTYPGDTFFPFRTTVGLQWTGKAWSHIEAPSIWRDGNTYIVNYMGTSQEFKDYTNGFAEKKPITGSKLSCRIFQPGGVTGECVYTHRNGDVLHFRGMYSNITPYPRAYGTNALSLGNIGMSNVTLYSVDNRVLTWGGRAYPGASPQEFDYASTNKKLGPFTINTPNHGNDSFKHYLRPQNTVQTFTDPTGAQWKYSINNSQLMTKIDRPGNVADITINYTNGRVSSVTNPNGTWTYGYSSAIINNTRITTVTDPLGGVTKVQYNTVEGYVLQSTDQLSRVTKYEYDAGARLSKVTYPDLNYVTFTYDVRGNIISKTEYPKPNSGLAPITETAKYPTICNNSITCNRPISVTDARGQTTTFEYDIPERRQAVYYFGEGGPAPTYFPYDFGTTQPTKVTSPEPIPGAIRPEIRNQYKYGALIRSAYCRTQASCIGTADEVVTTYDYGGTEGDARLLYGLSVTADGQTLTTCYGYDANSRRVTETPPRANVAVCPKIVAPNSGVTSPAIAQPSSAPVIPTP